jgi:hypothetical protein
VAQGAQALLPLPGRHTMCDPLKLQSQQLTLQQLKTASCLASDTAAAETKCPRQLLLRSAAQQHAGVMSVVCKVVILCVLP